MSQEPAPPGPPPPGMWKVTCYEGGKVVRSYLTPYPPGSLAGVQDVTMDSSRHEVWERDGEKRVLRRPLHPG